MESHTVIPQTLFVLNIMAMLFKLFFFMRISKRLSVITTMIMTCIYDLRFFMTFFILLIVFFAMAMNIIHSNP